MLCLEYTNRHLDDLDTKQPKKLNLSYKYSLLETDCCLSYLSAE